MMSTLVKTHKDTRINLTLHSSSVPENWKVMPGLAVLKPKKAKNVGLKEQTVLSLSYGKIKIKPTDQQHGLVPESYEGYQIVDPGNIIIRPTDLQNDQVSLRVGISDHKGIITSAYLCLETKGDLTPGYAYLLLHTYDLNKTFYGLGSGLRQNLDWDDFKRLSIFVPPVDEQETIVRYIHHLDLKVNKLIKAKKKQIELLNEQKQAIIHKAITRGLDPTVPFSPSSNDYRGDIPAHWIATRLKNVASVQTGITLGKNYGEAPVKSYPYLRVANVQAGRLDLSLVKDIYVPETDAIGCTLQYGDVLMTEGGDRDKLGRGCLWQDEIPGCLHQNHLFAVRCKSTLLPEFLIYVLGSRHGRSYFELTAKQTTNLASTNRTILLAFPLLLPPLHEQKKIVDSIEIDTKDVMSGIKSSEQEVSLILEYRNRLVSDAVTGRLNVSNLELAETDISSYITADNQEYDEEEWEDNASN